MAKRVLIVDDESSIRNMVSQVLRSEGYDTHMVESGEDALKAFLDEVFPLVFTDVRMGGMSGLDLLQKISKFSQHTNVVIMTSHATMDVAISALKAGAYDFLQKPFEDLELISNVARRAMQNFELIKERAKLVETLKSRNKALENLNKAFRALAIRDGLTGLFNHRYLQETLGGEVVRAERYDRDLTLLFIDVDFFKKFNDEYGHQYGDLVLKHISRIIQRNIRQTDIPARYGGEEFVIVMPETSKEQGEVVGEKLREAVQTSPITFVEGQADIKVTISGGVASLGVDGNTASDLLNKADQAVYAAKHSGRNKICIAGEDTQRSKNAVPN